MKIPHSHCLVIFASSNNRDIQSGYGIPKGWSVDPSILKGQTVDFSHSKLWGDAGEMQIRTAFVMPTWQFKTLSVIQYGGDIYAFELTNLVKEGFIQREGPALPKSWFTQILL